MIRNLFTLFLSSTLVLVLTGCASGEFFPEPKTAVDSKVKQNSKQHTDTLCVSKTGQLVDCKQLATRLQNEQVLNEIQEESFQQDIRAIHYSHPLEAGNNTVLVGEYIEQMATEILRNLTIPMDDAIVGVTSFVEFSEDLSTVNHFGNMLAENFIYELQQNGIPVIDYKVTGGVRVISTGDFVFSRNADELLLDGSMTYVLTGTMAYNKRGLVINARMVNFENKRVVSTSKKLIPYFVLDSIIPSSDKHAVIGE